MPSLPLVYFTPVGSSRLLRVGRQFTDLPLSKLVLHLAYYFGPTERKYVSPLSIQYVPGAGLCLWAGNIARQLQQRVWDQTTWVQILAVSC